MLSRECRSKMSSNYNTTSCPYNYPTTEVLSWFNGSAMSDNTTTTTYNYTSSTMLSRFHRS